MENTSGSSKKKGLFAKAIERCRSFGSFSKMKNRSKYNLSSPMPAFSNRSKSISYQDLTKKKKLFFKTFQRSWSLSSWSLDMKTQFKYNSTSSMGSLVRRSQSIGRASSFRVLPGCFTVCVGPNKERFVLKMVCLNDPLFQDLLQHAEKEFGYASDGPLMLPCDVEMFEKVMLEIEQQSSPDNSPKCSLSRSPYRYGLISPSKFTVGGPI